MGHPSRNLCRSSEGVLILIDIQTRLSSAMPETVRARVLKNTAILVQAASMLDIPFIITRQYPKRLGDTEPVIPAQTATTIDKTAFSCFRAGGFPQTLEKSARHQVILAGMESHVCILQTAFDLLANNYQVFVAEDAVCSRTAANHRNAVTRMAQHGVTLTNTESVLFEWLEDASHPRFKSISCLIK